MEGFVQAQLSLIRIMHITDEAHNLTKLLVASILATLLAAPSNPIAPDQVRDLVDAVFLSLRSDNIDTVHSGLLQLAELSKVHALRHEVTSRL